MEDHGLKGGDESDKNITDASEGSAAGIRHEGKSSVPPPPRKSMPPPAPRFDDAKSTVEDADGKSKQSIASSGQAAHMTNGQPFRTPPPKFHNKQEGSKGSAAASNGQTPRESTAAESIRPRSSEEERARLAALAAARAAAAHVTPAQREKAIAEAASAVYTATRDSERAARSAEAAAADQAAAAGPASSSEGSAPREAPTYESPAWSGIPRGLNYFLEVMKSGQIIHKSSVAEKAFYTFGRSPGCDFPLEHPSSSRLHAVLQFRGSDGRAFLYDPGSAHGTFVNKRQIAAKTYAPLRVGDMFKFGRSSRVCILGGPEAMRPEVGLTREQRRTAALLEAKEARKVRDAQIAKAQMEAARAGGASWGFGEDAVEDEDDLNSGGEGVDWRVYAQSHSLSDKQQKLVAKIKKREARITNLQRELDKIKAKQTAMEELTAGQAAVLVRNEQDIDRSAEELEDLEEMLNESIADSLRSAKQKVAGREPSSKKKKRKKTEEEEEELASSSEDEFYDRTADGGGRRKKRGKDGAAAQDAASLYGKKEALLLERRKLEEAVAKELKGKAAAAQPEPAAAASSSGAASAGGEGGENDAAEDGVDALDAFMSNVETQIEQDKVGTLRKDIEKIDREVAEAERLLRLADPDGYYREGTRAAEAAKAKGLKAMEAEKKRREAAERQRRERLAVTAQEQAFVPEVEEDEEMPEAAAAATSSAPDQARDTSASSAGQQPTAGAQPGPSPGVAAGGPGAPDQAAGESWPDQATEESQPKPEGSSLHRLAAEDPGVGSFGLEVRKRPEGLLSREQLRAQAAAAARGEAANAGGPAQPPPGGLLANLVLLQRGGRIGGEEEEEAVEEAAVEAVHPREAGWQPPQGQKGDGRTKLNDLLGY